MADETPVGGLLGPTDLLANVEYGDLLQSLRQDLQLDPLIDLLPTKGLALTTQVPQVGQALVWNGEQWVPQFNAGGVSSQLLVQGGQATPSLNFGATGSSAGTTVLFSGIGGTSFPNTCVACVINVWPGPQWPTYYSAELIDKTRFQLELACASPTGSPATFGVDWIALGT